MLPYGYFSSFPHKDLICQEIMKTKRENGAVTVKSVKKKAKKKKLQAYPCVSGSDAAGAKIIIFLFSNLQIDLFVSLKVKQYVKICKSGSADTKKIKIKTKIYLISPSSINNIFLKF